MSIIHVNQIKNHVSKLFDGKIDMADAGKPGLEYDNQFISRSLAAYAIYYLSGADPNSIGKSITDGGDDNGIDAIFYHEPERKLYIVQSKWIQDGSGEPSNGDMKKFIAGIKDLFNMRFDRFNNKVNVNRALFTQILNDPQSTYNIVIAYTGINTLAEPSRRDLDDLREEMNDASELLVITPLNQALLHNSLTARLAGKPINVEVGIKSWGKVESPHVAYYGQVAAGIIAEWWQQYGDRLFAKNLRSLLGDTEVNTEMKLTLQEEPNNFWYYNNGITIIASKITKTMAGGSNTDFGTFHCENISVVNGAQTVSTIGREYSKTKTEVEKALVPVRIISLETAEVKLEHSITKTNNRQNRIDNRDFVTLDPEQSRLRAELGVDEIIYHVIRSETFSRTINSFDLVEATSSLACSSGKPHLFVQLKREIGKLWEDIARAPYKELFNPSVNSLFVWRAVLTQRLIDANIEKLGESCSGRDFSVTIHGNRMIAAIVFQKFNLNKFGDPAFNYDEITSSLVMNEVQSAFKKLIISIDKLYPGAIIPTLFKNLTKCTKMYEDIK